MDLEPDSLCLDGAALPSESDRIDQAIRKYKLLRHPKAAAFFARAGWDTAVAAVRRKPTAKDFEDPRWPAHLHINVVPKVRGTGVAAALMNRWFERLRETGSPGCHLQTLVENTPAVAFFERMGFVKHGPTPLVPGLRHRGKRLHQQTMGWSL